MYLYISIHAQRSNLQVSFPSLIPTVPPGGLIESVASVGSGTGAPCSSPPSRHGGGTAAGRRSRFGYVLGAFESSFQVANSQVGIWLWGCKKQVLREGLLEWVLQKMKQGSSWKERLVQSSEKDEIGMDLFGCEQIEEDLTLLSMKRSRQPPPSTAGGVCIYSDSLHLWWWLLWWIGS